MRIPYGNSYGDSHGDSHRIPMGMGWEWERKFHSPCNRVNNILVYPSMLITNLKSRVLTI